MQKCPGKGKRCPNGTHCNKTTNYCEPKKKGQNDKKKGQNDKKKGQNDNSSIMSMIKSILSPFNVTQKPEDEKENTEGVESIFDQVKKRLPDFGVYGISSVALAASVRWVLFTAWDTAVSIATDYVGPNLPYLTMMLFICAAAYWGVNKYKYNVEHKEKLGKWHSYITAVHAIIENYDGTEDPTKELRKLKKTIDSFCGDNFACEDQTNLIGQINRILNCDDNDECKQNLVQLLGFIEQKLTKNLQEFGQPQELIEFMSTKGEFSCTKGQYNITLDDTIKYTSSIRDSDTSMSYSLSSIKFDYPENANERQQNVFKAAVVALKDALVKENNAIHIVQYNFLKAIVKNNNIYESSVSWSAFLFGGGAKKEFEKLVSNLDQIETETLDEWAEFFCDFDTHFKQLNAVFKENGGFNASVRLLKRHIKQIQTVREIQFKYVLDLYNAYLTDVSQLHDPTYLQKYLCLMTDAGDNPFNGLCARAMMSSKIISDIRKNMSPDKLLEAYKKAESGKSYSDTFATMSSYIKRNTVSEYTKRNTVSEYTLKF
jgi:hypothetical protein